MRQFPERNRGGHASRPECRAASKSLMSALSWADEGGHGPCGGLRFSTPPTTSEMTHARVCIFPVRVAAGVGGLGCVKDLGQVLGLITLRRLPQLGSR